MKMLPVLWVLTGLGLYACKNPVNTGGKKEAAVQNRAIAPTGEVATNSKGRILHNIIVQESGSLKIARAYLSFKDGSLLPKTNTVALGDVVYLALLPDKSWLNGTSKVSIEASQQIVTNDGELVLDTPTLFGGKMPVDRSRFSRIYLQATITKTRPDIDYFIIQYRVWDGLSNDEVKGSYTLYIDDLKE
ncbi:MAG TPA: hypothetical protein VM884_01235 [Flavisolibacter sp.]|nr:hypothetical protein [Flavisolibacter sp.]